MHRSATAALAILLATFAGIAPVRAQWDSSASQPWLEMKLDKKKKVKLNLTNASIDHVIRFLAKNAGVTIVKDPTLSGTVSLAMAKPVGLADAFSMVSALLELKGYEFQSKDTFLVVKQKARSTATGRMGSMGSSTGMGGGMGGGRSSQPTELRLYTLQYASASAVAKTINDVFGSSSSSNSTGFFFGGPGGGGPGGGGPGGMSGPGGGGPGGMSGGPPGMSSSGSTSSSQGTAKASYDEYSNTVIVNASNALHTQIAALIKGIDTDVKQPLTTEFYSLVFASAEDVATTLQSVLTANAPKGRGGTTTTSSQQGMGFPFGGRSTSTSSGSVSADTRSNAVIVTTTEANQALVAKLVQKLDKEIAYESSTEVIPLANARATDMADILNEAFNSKTSSSSSRRSTSSSSSSRTSTGGNRSNNSGFSLPGSEKLEDDPNNLYVQLDDPLSGAGDLATAVTVTQGGGFGFGPFQSGGSTSSSSKKSTVSRDAQGRIVNIADLSSKVTIVADSNTNSLIVVGDPEAVKMIRQILEQLDKIPEQVMIETIIVEASLDATTRFGLEWSFTQNKAFGDKDLTGTVKQNYGLESSTTNTSGLRYTLTGSDLSAFLTAFKSDQKFRVLSTPRIFTSNNTEATINISQSIPYVTSQREDSNGNLTFNYSFQDVGIVLTVTPQISPSGTVTLDVEQTANDLQGYTSFNAPIINQREATTTISVADGETIVLGGIMRTAVTATTNKVPLLGDIPLLGELFKSTSKNDTKTELLVFLTPHIVRNSADAKKVMQKQTSELSKDSQKKLQGGKK